MPISEYLQSSTAAPLLIGVAGEDFMNTCFSVRRDPNSDIIEEYAFQRLSEADTDAVEEHLLVCSNCQTSLAALDEYMLLMKFAMSGSVSPGRTSWLELEKLSETPNASYPEG